MLAGVFSSSGALARRSRVKYSNCSYPVVRNKTVAPSLAAGVALGVIAREFEFFPFSFREFEVHPVVLADG